MLQALRDKTSGWVATVILGLLIVPFALFGINDYMGRNNGNYVARLSTPPSWWHSAPSFWPASSMWTHDDITIDEFRARLEEMRQMRRQQQGEAFDNQAFESANNKRQILEEMIDERVMRLSARDAGLRVSADAVRRSIAGIPEFQVEGKFNAETYARLLGQLNPPRTPLQFEQSVRDDLERNALVGTLYNTGFVTPSQADAALKLLFQQRDVTAAIVPLKADDTRPVSEADIAAWYKSNAARYQSPETVTLEYVEVDAAKLTPKPVDDLQLRAMYEAEKGKYGAAEQRRVAHVLVSLDAKADAATVAKAKAQADAIAAEAQAPGADFAAIARAKSGDLGSKNIGGELGWIGRGGGMPKPFEDAMFALQAGQISAPVKTDAGWHVIKLEEVRAGTQRTFEEVRPELLAKSEQDARERTYNDLLSTLMDEVMKNPAGFAQIAAKQGLAVQKLGPIAKGEREGLGSVPALQKEAFSEARIRDGSVSDPVEIGTERSVLFRVTAHAPAKAQPLTQVRDRVMADVRADRAGKQAETEAKALVQAVGEGGQTLAALGAAKGLRVQPLPGMTRNMPIPTEEAVKAIFAAPAPSATKPSAGQVALPDGSRLVFQVDAIKPADMAAIPPAQLAQLKQQLGAANGDQAAKAYVAERRKKYKVEVYEDKF